MAQVRGPGIRVVIAPDSFKGSLTAPLAAFAVADGWRIVRPADELVRLPQADGGEGTLDAIAASDPDAVRRPCGMVTGPGGAPVPGAWLELVDGTAVVELASVSGLPLVRRPDALGATTRGLGEVIGAALDAGARSVVVALGGSASTDGGSGVLAALGMRFLDREGRELPAGGAALARLARVDIAGLRPIPGGVTLLADVTAPLTGPSGAAHVFAPQKGADAAEVAALEAALARFATMLGGDPDAPGAGAAGGTAYGLRTAYGASIVAGADHVARLTGLAEAIPAADVLLTGEGRFDAQSTTGKVVGHALAAAGAVDDGRRPRVGVIAGALLLPPAMPDGTPVWSASLTALAGEDAASALADPERYLRLAGAAAARALV